MTIHIPDWLFCGPFWLGFGIAAVLAIAFVIWAMAQIGPRF